MAGFILVVICVFATGSYAQPLGSAVAVSQTSAVDPASCWYGLLQPQACCDLRKGLTGDTVCWDGPFNFDSCCPNEAAQVKQQKQANCWLGGIPSAVCCDVRKGRGGDPACWDETYTFEMCCPNEAAFIENAHTSECWSGGTPGSQAACCDVRKGVQGDTVCWDAVFTFDLCCPEERTLVAKAIEENCWYGGLDPAMCCNPASGPKGEERCWEEPFSFESCCTPGVYAGLERRATQATCWLGEVTPAVCCDLSKGAQGDPFCWSAQHTFDICCPAEAAIAAAFREACWVGVPGLQGHCCDTGKGPRGDPECWGGMYLFETCCI